MKSLFIAALLLAVASALEIRVFDTKEYCLSIKGDPKQFLYFSYIVRGRNEENVGLKVIAL